MVCTAVSDGLMAGKEGLSEDVMLELRLNDGNKPDIQSLGRGGSCGWGSKCKA